MTTKDEIKKELKELLALDKKLFKLAADNEHIPNFGYLYQSWYSRALRILELLAPDRMKEFVGYYEIDPKRKITDVTNYNIQDYVMGVGAGTDRLDKPLWDINTLVSIRIMNQMQILGSIENRIDTIFADIEGHIHADLQDAELEAANKLRMVNLRAAGSLAGVVLERHLRRVAKNHGITIRKRKPAIADLNDPLKGAVVYDTPTWRKIQLLADIRNLSNRSKGKEPTKEQVDELIEGVNQIIKTVF
jgi:hypothetical protein